MTRITGTFTQKRGIEEDTEAVLTIHADKTVILDIMQYIQSTLHVKEFTTIKPREGGCRGCPE